MTERDDDRDLRARFEALRAADADLDPGYARLRASVRRPRPALRPERVLALLGAVAAASAALWLALPERPDARLDPAAIARFDPGRWPMPSDALLDLSDLPGDALLRELPALGAAESFEPEDPSAPGTGARAPAPQQRRPFA